MATPSVHEDTFDYDGTAARVDTLFKSGQDRYRSAFPDSPIDFETLNLATRLSQDSAPLARGHFSDVFRGRLDDKITVAIKILRLPVYTSDQDHLYQSIISRFFRELNCCYSLNHPNIARMLGYTLEHGTLGLVSLWYHSGNLVQYLRSNPGASKQDLILDVVEGLEYLHGLFEKVVHADLKGENVLVDEKGIACLGDFGISKQIGDLSKTTGFTTTGGISGTTPWMAPELFEEDVQLTRASDIYSLAGVLLEILCPGKRPFHYVSNQLAVIRLKARGETPDLHFYAELQEDSTMWDLLVRCWSQDPGERPGIQELVHRLYGMFSLRPRAIHSIVNRPPITPVDDEVPSMQVVAATASGLWPSVRRILPGEVHQLLSALFGVAPEGRDCSAEQPVLLRPMLPAEEYYLDNLIAVQTHMTTSQNHGAFTSNSDATMADCFGDLIPFRNISEKFLGAAYINMRVKSPISRHLFDEIILQMIQEFVDAYDIYVEQLPTAQRRLDAAIKSNPRFRLAFMGNTKTLFSNGIDTESILDIPLDQIRIYRNFLVAFIGVETNPADTDALQQALSLIENRCRSRLIKWQKAGAVGQAGKWHALVYQRGTFSPLLLGEETTKQAVLYEFIWREMCFDASFARMEERYILKLERSWDIMPFDKLQRFVQDVFGGLRGIYHHHRQMLGRLHSIQRATYPSISSRLILCEILKSVSECRALYGRYVQSYPSALFRIQDELHHNDKFRRFHFDHRTFLFPSTQDDAIDFVKMVVPRLRGYSDVFLKDLEQHTPPGHKDHILMQQLKHMLGGTLSDVAQAAVESDAKAKVMLLASRLCFVPEGSKPKGLNLFEEKRRLIHSSELWYRSRHRHKRREVWSRALGFLLDNYLLLTKIQRKHEMILYVCFSALPLNKLVMEVSMQPLAANGTFDYLFTVGLPGAKLKGLFVKSEQDKSDWRRVLGEALAVVKRQE